MDKEISFKVLTMDGVEREVVNIRAALRVDEFINELELSEEDAEGRPVRWHLQDLTIGRTLPYESSLAEAGVEDGHHLSLIYVTFSGCFSESAKVLFPTGETLPMGRILGNDFIISFDPETESFVKNKVQGLFREVHAMQIIVNNKLITTPDQQLLLADGSWKRADHVVKGDALWKFPYRAIEVKEIETKKALMTLLSPTLQYSQCFVVDGFIAKNFGERLASTPKRRVSIPGEIDVFLSYSAKDENAAKKIFDMLGKQKVNVFLAEKNIEPGQYWEDTIREELKKCRNFWILATPNILGSEWVITEWAVAWALEKKIVPILLRCTAEALPRRLQAYQCVDFHNVDKAIQTLQNEKKRV